MCAFIKEKYKLIKSINKIKTKFVLKNLILLKFGGFFSIIWICILFDLVLHVYKMLLNILSCIFLLGFTEQYHEKFSTATSSLIM